MNILRKIKLRILGIEPDEKSLKIIKFIEENILNLTEFKDPKYPDFIFYMKGDINMLQYNIRLHYLYFRYKWILSLFYEKFNLEYTEIEQIMKYLMEEHYKLKVETTLLIYNTTLSQSQKRRIYHLISNY